MSSTRTPQMMKAATAAKKLGIYLPATPEEFQNSEISRTELNQLQESPPEWLQQLRQNGPHPRLVVASKLGVSIAGLARAGVIDNPLTTAEIKELLQAPPAWLVEERATHARVQTENRRVKEIAAAERKKKERSAGR